MKVLIDSNVALNILLKQPASYAGSRNIFSLAETGEIAGFVSASAITDIYYIAGKILERQQRVKLYCICYRFFSQPR